MGFDTVEDLALENLELFYLALVVLGSSVFLSTDSKSLNSFARIEFTGAPRGSLIRKF